jgi:hypothetical protein
MNRRKFMSRSGATIAGLTTLPVITQADPEVGTSGDYGGDVIYTAGPENNFSTTGSASGASGGNVELATALTQYAASAEGNYNPYWQIDFEVFSNSYTHDGSQTYAGLHGNQSTARSNYPNWVAKDNKYYVGGGTPKTDGEDFTHAEAIANEVLGLLPYYGTFMTAVEILGNLLAIFDDSADDVYTHYFNWGSDYGLISDRDVKQGATFNRFVAEADPSDEVDVIQEDSATGFDGNFFQVYNTFDATFLAPSSSPEEVLSMSTSERQSRGIKTLSGSDIKTQQEASKVGVEDPSDIGPDEDVVLAPVEARVETSTDTLHAETLDELERKRAKRRQNQV